MSDVRRFLAKSQRLRGELHRDFPVLSLCETNQQPEALTNQQPNVVTNKKPNVVTNKQPNVVTNKQPEALIKKQPEVTTNKQVGSGTSEPITYRKLATLKCESANDQILKTSRIYSTIPQQLGTGIHDSVNQSRHNSVNQSRHDSVNQQLNRGRHNSIPNRQSTTRRQNSTIGQHLGTLKHSTQSRPREPDSTVNPQVNTGRHNLTLKEQLSTQIHQSTVNQQSNAIRHESTINQPRNNQMHDSTTYQDLAMATHNSKINHHNNNQIHRSTVNQQMHTGIRDSTINQLIDTETHDSTTNPQLGTERHQSTNNQKLDNARQDSIPNMTPILHLNTANKFKLQRNSQIPGFKTENQINQNCLQKSFDQTNNRSYDKQHNSNTSNIDGCKPYSSNTTFQSKLIKIKDIIRRAKSEQTQNFSYSKPCKQIFTNSSKQNQRAFNHQPCEPICPTARTGCDPIFPRARTRCGPKCLSPRARCVSRPRGSLFHDLRQLGLIDSVAKAILVTVLVCLVLAVVEGFTVGCTLPKHAAPRCKYWLSAWLDKLL